MGLETEQMRAGIAHRLFGETGSPVKIGRFVVIEAIGRGAMGTVFSAYDPDLDRRVAVKVLRLRREDAGHERLLAEAKVLARLNHPNIVTVHEVGVSSGGVYMAMEFVDGGTLRDLFQAVDARNRARDPRLLQAFVEAARGLAFAHAAGVIHGDLKPVNMLIGRDGRLRIADFGLARATKAPDPLASSEDRGAALVDTSPETEVEPSMYWAGTPGYMAPEQFAGRCDERTDQFNLCATFWEAIYCTMPYRGATVPETCTNALEGNLQPVPPGVGAPGWLRRLMLRGLAPDRDDRFEDLTALLRELERGRRRSRTRGRVAFAAAGAFVAAGLAIWSSRGDPDRTAACRAEADARAPAWDEARARAIGRAFESTELPFAAGTWSDVSGRLDAWKDAWIAADAEACRTASDPDATRRSDAEARRGCLERAAASFSTLIELFAEPDREIVRSASLAARALPTPERCEQQGVERGLSAAPEPTEHLTHAAVELSRAAVERKLRRVDASMARTDALLEQLSRPGDERLRAYVHQERAFLAILRGDAQAGLEHASTMLADAELAGDLDAQVHAWRIMAAAAAKRGHEKDAEFHLERADSLARRNEVSEITRARLEWGAASVLKVLERYDDAAPRFERALALYRERWPDYPKLGTLHCEYADALGHTDLVETAVEHATQCARLEVEALGADHPNVATAWLILGQYRMVSRDPAAAEEAVTRALNILDANPWFSPTRRLLGYKVRGQSRTMAGRIDDALEDFARALELAERIPDAGAVYAPGVHNEIANVLVEAERFDEARTHLETAIELGDGTPAVSRSSRGSARLNLAIFLGVQGECEDALAWLERARAILDDDRPPHMVLSPIYWMHVSRGYRLCERPEASRAALDRALEAVRVGRPHAIVRGQIHLEEARVLVMEGERDAAREALQAGRESLEAANAGAEKYLEAIEALERSVWSERSD